MTFYEHPGGGIVFSAGSLTFGGSLVIDRTIQELLRNVWRAPASAEGGRQIAVGGNGTQEDLSSGRETQAVRFAT